MLEELDQIDEYLSACQLGITMASIGIGFLGEPAVAKLIEPIFGGLSHGAAVAISVAIAYTLVTTLHVTVGEQAPKLYRDLEARETAPGASPARSTGSGGSAPLHGRADLVVQRRSRASSACARTSSTRSSHSSEDLQVLISQSADPGQARPGRGQ